MRLASLSGIANRYVDLRLGPANAPKIPNDGVIPTHDTTSAVDLDQLFNTLNPPTLQGAPEPDPGVGLPVRRQGRGRPRRPGST